MLLNLKELREKNGMSRYQLSKLTGLQNSTIVSAEIEIDNLAFLTVKKICDALEVDINKVKKLKKQLKERFKWLNKTKFSNYSW